MEKFKNLQKRLTELSSFALAFSGGADSAFLLAVAKKINPKNFIAITVSSQFVTKSEIDFAKKNASSMGIQHMCLEMDILGYGNIVSNTLERCYFCKKQMFAMIKKTAQKYGISTLVHGINLDDLKDFRPGLKAAEELGFLSPLADAKITKKEVRGFSRQMGLETWDKPSQSCLATRIAYNEEITAQKLDAVNKAETFLKMLDFVHVRVRIHGKTARIEVEPEQIIRISDKNIRQKILQQFLKLGFENTSIDIDGYKIT